MKTAVRVLACASILLMSCTAFAAGQGGNPRMACRQDAETFCKGIQPGGGRIVNCLEDHYKEISDACYTALQNAPAPPGQHGGNSPSGNAHDGPPPPDDNDGPPPND